MANAIKEAALNELIRIATIAVPFGLHWLYLCLLAYVGAFLANRLRSIRHEKGVIKNKHIIYYAVVTGTFIKFVDIVYISDTMKESGLVSVLALICGVMSDGIVSAMLKYSTALMLIKTIFNSNLFTSLRNQVVGQSAQVEEDDASSNDSKDE